MFAISAYVGSLEFFIDDKPISFVKSFSHLGHLINSDLSDVDDIAKRRKRFNKTNWFIVNKKFKTPNISRDSATFFWNEN